MLEAKLGRSARVNSPVKRCPSAPYQSSESRGLGWLEGSTNGVLAPRKQWGRARTSSSTTTGRGDGGPYAARQDRQHPASESRWWDRAALIELASAARARAHDVRAAVGVVHRDFHRPARMRCASPNITITALRAEFELLYHANYVAAAGAGASFSRRWPGPP